MSYEDLQSTLNQCMETKKSLGYKIPKNPDGTPDLDKTMKMKQEQTEAMTKAVQDYYAKYISGDPEQSPPVSVGAPTSAPQKLFEVTPASHRSGKKLIPVLF